MSKAKTDNSMFWDKVLLRLNHLPEKNNINVLDCFSGNGEIWDQIKKMTKKNIIKERMKLIGKNLG